MRNYVIRVTQIHIHHTRYIPRHTNTRPEITIYLKYEQISIIQ